MRAILYNFSLCKVGIQPSRREIRGIRIIDRLPFKRIVLHFRQSKDNANDQILSNRMFNFYSKIFFNSLRIH